MVVGINVEVIEMIADQTEETPGTGLCTTSRTVHPPIQKTNKLGGSGKCERNLARTQVG